MAAQSTAEQPISWDDILAVARSVSKEKEKHMSPEDCEKYSAENVKKLIGKTARRLDAEIDVAIKDAKAIANIQYAADDGPNFDVQWVVGKLF